MTEKDQEDLNLKCVEIMGFVEISHNDETAWEHPVNVFYGWIDGDTYCEKERWNPCINHHQAFLVAERLLELAYPKVCSTKTYSCGKDLSGLYWCRHSAYPVDSYAETLPLAVVRACITAYETHNLGSIHKTQ